MSLADQLESDVSDVFLNTDEHARSIPVTLPRRVDAESITGVWDVLTEEEVETSRGKEVVYNASFVYAASDTILTESTAVVDGLTWVCTYPGATYAGMKTSKWTSRGTLHRANGGGNKS